LEREAEELNSRINTIRLELYESQSRVEELRTSSAAAESELVRLEADSVRLAGDVNELSEQLERVRATADELEGMLSGLRQDAVDAHEERGRIEVELTKVQAEAEHLARSCMSEIGQPLNEVLCNPESSAIQPDSPVQRREPTDPDASAQNPGDEGASHEGAEQERAEQGAAEGQTLAQPDDDPQF